MRTIYATPHMVCQNSVIEGTIPDNGLFQAGFSLLEMSLSLVCASILLSTAVFYYLSLVSPLKQSYSHLDDELNLRRVENQLRADLAQKPLPSHVRWFLGEKNALYRKEIGGQTNEVVSTIHTWHWRQFPEEPSLLLLEISLNGEKVRKIFFKTGEHPCELKVLLSWPSCSG